MNQDLIPILLSFSTTQMSYHHEKSASVLNSESKIEHVHASQNSSYEKNPGICFTSFSNVLFLSVDPRLPADNRWPNM